MPMSRLGRLSQDPLDRTKRKLETLPWADETGAALARYREQQPGSQELARVAAYQTTPREFFDNPHLRVQALENELAHMFRTFLAALEQTLDSESACRVSYAAGLAHGKRRLSTFLRGQELPGGAKSMAMWQDTAHSSAGARHTTALFVRYDDELVEVVRTEDSFGSSTGKQSAVAMAYFDGFMDGYQAVDPRLSRVEELTRERPDGGVEFVHRFWYQPENRPSEDFTRGVNPRDEAGTS
jgi:hypothetical protein